jgi:hypothetical protein
MTPLYWAAYALINTALALFGLHILARGVGRGLQRFGEISNG